MGRIKINPDALKVDASRLNFQIKTLEENKKSLNNLIIEISTSWEGEASKVFISKIHSMIEKSDKAIEVLTSYLDYIKKVVKQFEDLDKNASTKINGSF